MNVNSADLASQKPLESPAKVPAHQHVYERVRKLILFGDLAPGQAVTIQGLAETLDHHGVQPGVGAHPLEEQSPGLYPELNSS